MTLRILPLFILLSFLPALPAAAAIKPATFIKDAAPFTYAVPSGPPVRDRYTMLLAHFDRGHPGNADFAWADPRNTGYQTPKNYGGKGFSGRCIICPGPTQYCAFDGLDNYRPSHGTADFWLKAARNHNTWADDKDHYILWMAPDVAVGYPGRTPYTMVVIKNGALKQLEFRIHNRSCQHYSYDGSGTIGALAVPCGDLDPGKWHHVVISWDLRGQRGRIMLGLDGRGMRGEFDLPSPATPIPGRIIYFSGHPWELFGVGHASWHGLADELVITSKPLRFARRAGEIASHRRPGPDELKLMAYEDACRRWLDELIRIQENGGWSRYMFYPSGKPCHDSGHLSNDNSMGTATFAVPLLRAYQYWGDYRYLAAIRLVCAPRRHLSPQLLVQDARGQPEHERPLPGLPCQGHRQARILGCFPQGHGLHPRLPGQGRLVAGPHQP